MKLSTKAITWLILFFSFTNPVKAQSCDPILRPDSLQYVVIGGSVLNSQVNGNTLYLVGSFNGLGKKTGSFISINEATGKPQNINSWPQSNGTINKIVADGNGGWIIGGSFTQVGTYARTNLAQIDAAGQVTSWNPSPGGQVNALVVSGTTLYVGGDFTSISATTRNHVAAYDLVSGNILAWDPNAGTTAGNTINSMLVNAGLIYVGGKFTSVGGQTRNNIAAVDAATGLATTWNPNASSTVNVVALSGQNIYIGGAFTQVNATTRNHIAAIDVSTGLITSWNPNSDNNVYVIDPGVSSLYVGGSFSNIGTQSRFRFAELDMNTSNATGLDLKLNSATVYEIKHYGTNLYVGGTFNAKKYDTARYNLAQVDLVGDTVTRWESQADGVVKSIEKSGSSLFVGGGFTALGYRRREGAAAYDMDADTITRFYPCITRTVGNQVVEAIAIKGDTVYLGGDFNWVRASVWQYLCAVKADNGDLVTSFHPTIGLSQTEIKTMALGGTSLYIGGSFSQVNNTGRNNLASVNASTGTLNSWNPDPYDPNNAVIINKIIYDNSKVYVCGDFYGFTPNYIRSNIAAVDNTAGTPTSWNPGADAQVYDMLLQNNLIYAAGAFNNAGGQFRPRLAAVDITTGNANAWNPYPNSTVNHIMSDGNYLYASGAFTSIGTNALSRNRFAQIDVNGLAGSWDLSFPNANDPVYTVSEYNNVLYLGGTFTTISNKSQPYWASFTVQTIPPTASITGNNSVCAGTSVTYTSTTNVTGATYQWLVNNVNQGNNSTYTYTPSNNDQVKCIVTVPVGSCYTAQTDTSNVITMTVTPNITPTISISGNTTICAGTQTTYTATTNIVGGTYQWKVNNINQGTGSTYSYTPLNNDQVICVITAPAGCYQPTTATSNTLTITVNPVITATAGISTANTTVCAGMQVTFNATTNITGAAYQWQVNNVNAGTNSSSYSYTPANNDVIKCIITPPAGTCYNPSPITSNTVTMTVTPNTTPTVSISGNSTVCVGTQVTYTATSNVAGVTYQWQVNNVNAGANLTTYTYTPTNADQVRCTITTPAGCFSPTADTSNVITMTVNPVLSPTASINASATTVCAGINATFTATTNITGADYQWEVNATNAGTNSGTYTYAPANGDNVTCILTAPAGSCYDPTTITSNAITMTVNPNVTPGITISGPSSAVVGSLVNLTAIISNAGPTYSIDWKNNNVSFSNTSVPNTSYTKAPGTDNITAIITSPGCYNPATSNNLTIAEDLAVNGLSSQDSIKVYPNPFVNEIFVSGLAAGTKLYMYDVKGGLVKQWTTTVNNTVATYNTQGLAKGLYLLRLVDVNGSTITRVSVTRQ